MAFLSEMYSQLYVDKMKKYKNTVATFYMKKIILVCTVPQQYIRLQIFVKNNLRSSDTFGMYRQY